MKPIIILPPDTMAESDIAALRENGLCVVVSKDPAAVKFLDPIPSAAERTKTEDAAIQLSRKILAPGFWTNSETRATMAAHYVDILVHGTKLDPHPTQADLEKKSYDTARINEMERLGREEARAERAANKASRAALELAEKAKKKL